MIEGFANIDMLKAQCRIEADNHDEDALLTTYLQAAAEVVLQYLGRSLRSLYDEYGEVPAALQTAQLLLAADLYANREAGRVSSISAVNVGVGHLINAYRRIE